LLFLSLPFASFDIADAIIAFIIFAIFFSIFITAFIAFASSAYSFHFQPDGAVLMRFQRCQRSAGCAPFATRAITPLPRQRC
jgi:hypothetical protein